MLAGVAGAVLVGGHVLAGVAGAVPWWGLTGVMCWLV